MQVPHQKKTIASLTTFAFVLVALSGCIAEDVQASSIYVKDALTDEAAEVHVTFTQVQALPAGASEWITVYSGQRTIDLLALSAPAAKEKLSDLDLAPGPYDGLRIATSEAQAVLHNGTTIDLAVAGNVISLAQAFTVSSSGGLEILVDFDLERSIDLRGGVYAATVKEMRTSGNDIDGDGIPDFDDLDDPDLPEPQQDRHNGFGLCTAWTNTATARQQENSTVANSSAFQNLSRMATDAGQSIEAYCADQPFPGPPESVPENARQYYDAAMERRAAREGTADQAAPTQDQVRPNETGDQPTVTPGTTGRP